MLLLHGDLPGVGTVHHAVAPGILLRVVQRATSDITKNYISYQTEEYFN